MEGSALLHVQKSTSSSDSEYETDSSDELLSSNIGVQYQSLKITDQDRLEDYTKAKSYEDFRNKYFTRPTITKFLVVDSHTYAQDSSFDSSNYTINFNLKAGTSTAYDIYRDVIGFRLTNASIRNCPYNINTTNNVIHYTAGVNACTVTINPGLYTVTELAAIFSAGAPASTDAHFVTYSGTSHGTFTVTYLSSTVAGATATNKCGTIFKFDHTGVGTTIEWNTNNVSRGAAKVFGFFPRTVTTDGSGVTHSDKTPDLSQHHVDIVVPEIPSIACKRNSAGRNIIDRVPLQVSSGEYQYYFTTDTKHHYQNFFYPITLSQLSIQLYSENNEFYDCNKTDHSFEFEVMMLRHDG